MVISLKKFGTTLNGRQSGREAFAAFEPSLREVKDEEAITVDFEGVITFTPSWGDEFLGSLFKRFGRRLALEHTENPSVQATLELLGSIYGADFQRAAGGSTDPF